ncbi:uncharacterized protein SAMN05660297_00154 [Natronincola peptidivorans]|uniref:DUF177 domain-containing protein n=1 Tax=Natronincola peptidivorans TaxID=426128 RepID=A0A1H9YCF6_9FIRM|nr:DUF177 domain-containing protein [Natronincola peptidivorans]SES66557.1 uncharacterized protein SAMN05660297_00154 [Natronincola peptidivorans]
MKFDLNTLKREEHNKVTLDFHVNLDSINYYGDIFKVKKPVKVLGELYSVGEKIFLTCRLETELEVTCGRCLNFFLHSLKTSINVELVEEEILIQEDDSDDIIVCNDNILDFDKIIKEQITTSIPMRVLCNEACKGLCKTCGLDLNSESCQCNMKNNDIDHDIDPRLAKLKELFQQD